MKMKECLTLGVAILLVASLFGVAFGSVENEEQIEAGEKNLSSEPNTDETSAMYVLVNSTVYEPLKDELTRYKEDVENTTDLNVEIVRNEYADHVKIRNFLKEGYENEGLEGVFFVGNLPHAEFEISDDNEDTYDRFPIDHYYADLTGEWSDTNESGAYDEHLPGDGDLDPEIWLGRISMKTNWTDEIELYENYFEKVYQYRRGNLSVEDRSLLYIDDDWAPWADRYKQGLIKLYEDVTIVNDTGTTNAEDYSQRLQEGYEWVQIMCHANRSAKRHAFMEEGGPKGSGGNFTSGDLFEEGQKSLFQNVFTCGSADYTEENYLCGWYALTEEYGLANVGSTQPGSMLEFENYYGPLSEGKTMGEAMQQWWIDTVEDGFSWRSWFYGMTTIGDPTLSMVEEKERVDFGMFEYGEDELDLDIVMEEDKTARWVFYGDGTELETNETNDVEFDWSDHGDFDVREFKVEIEEYTDVLEIDWAHNDLSGEIPVELSNLQNLKILDLLANDLSGEIPAELGNLQNLESLRLSGNDLLGEIPAELVNLQNLKDLHLMGNDLSGEIPVELGNLQNLEYLDLTDNNLSGEIPTQLENLENLEYLALGANDLSGEIPTQLENLEDLEILVLFANDLSGKIPAELGNLQNLESISVAGNDLSGEIPAELGNLQNLESLWLSGNDLSGEIPAELGNLQNLLALALGDNNLSGEIPTEFSDLTGLKIVRLEQNDLDSYEEGAFSTQPNLGRDWYSLNLSHNDLSTEDIDNILSDLVESLDLEDRVPGEVDLTGNSEPSADGWNDKQTLEAEGWDVYVDGEPPEEYDLLFVVEDEVGDPIEDAKVEVNEMEETTDLNGEAMFEDLGSDTYDWEVTHDDYESESGEVEIEDQDETVTVTMEEEVMTYDLFFEVEDEDGDAIEGATVEVNGMEETTDEDGEAVFEDLEPDTYDWEVTHDDYETKDGEVEIVDEDVTETVTMEEIVMTYNLTFEVEDEDGNAIEGATVEVDGMEETTDSDGEAVFEDLEPDTYEYEVTHVDYETEDGEVEIVDEDETVTVIMEEDEEIPGFTSMILVLGIIIAVAIYQKKKQ